MSSFAQESQRYVGYGGAIEFIIPPWSELTPHEVELSNDTLNDEGSFIGINSCDEIWKSSMLNSAMDYNRLLTEGWHPEQARDVLPNACKTEINVQTNLREWMHIFDLRANPAAAPQMREVMISALADIKRLIPIVFDDI